MKAIGVVTFALFAVLVASSGSLAADELMKHSGRIVSIAFDARSFVLAEVGPWTKGAPLFTYRTIQLRPETEFAMIGRVPAGAGQLEGDFVEIPIAGDEYYMGDYVTVECRHEGARMIALKILVSDAPYPWW